MALSVPSRSALGFLCGALLLTAVRAGAAEFVVTTLADGFDGSCDADCTLREAVIAANLTAGADSILLSAGTHVLSSAGANEDVSATGDLDLTDPAGVTWVGAGAGLTTVSAAGLGDRVLEVRPGAVGTLQDLTLLGGSAAGGLGGNVRVRGALTLTRVTVAGGSALDGAGAHVDAAASLTLDQARISGNTATGAGGGVLNLGTLVATASLIDGNGANDGGGVDNRLSATFTNVTFSGNGAAGPGGAYRQSASLADGALVHVTFVGNAAGDGGSAVHLESEAGVVTIRSSILGDAGGGTGNCGGSSGFVVSLGDNVADDASCALTGERDAVVADVLLGPLASSGGATPTHAPLPGSPAIDAVGSGVCVDADQRAVTRPQDGDGDGIRLCDVGALELAGDFDLDGVADDDDSCVWVANPGSPQPDAGGVGAGSPPDGAGDACQCGDASGDGIVAAPDPLRYREALAGSLPLTADEEMRCRVTLLSRDCDLVQIVALSRGIAGAAPGVGQVCEAALNPGLDLPLPYLDDLAADSGWTVVDGPDAVGGPSQWSFQQGGYFQEANIGDAVNTPPAALAALSTLSHFGDPRWRDYRVDVPVLPEDDDGIGVIARLRDADSYYRFSVDRQLQYARIVKLEDGVASLIAEDLSFPDAFAVGSERVVSLEARGSTLRAYLDHELVLEGSDPDLPAGAVGLYAYAMGNPRVIFEELAVIPVRVPLPYVDELDTDAGWTFVDRGTTSGPSSWSFGGGQLTQSSNIFGPGGQELGTFAFFGDPEWADVQLDVDLIPGDDDDAGIIARFVDADSYYRFDMNAQLGRTRIVRVHDGAFSVLAQDLGFAAYQQGIPNRLSLVAQGDRLTGFLDGEPVVQATDAALGRGRIALHANAMSPISFERVEVKVPDGSLPVPLLYDPMGLDTGQLGFVDLPGSASGPGSWSFSAGFLVQSSNIGGAYSEPLGTVASVIPPGAPWTDVRIETDFVARDNDGVGLVARYQDAANHYRLVVSNAPALVQISVVRDGVLTVLASLDPSPVSYTQCAATTAVPSCPQNTLALEVEGLALRAFLNGAQVLGAIDIFASHASGGAGLLSVSMGQPDVAFDRLIITGLP